MARSTVELLRALRVTADRIAGPARYQWGHMGQCNCGHLAQTLTATGGQAIHRSALEREGDWSEQMVEYCPDSGLRIDDIITTMLAAGLELADLRHLERLSDPAVLALVSAEHLPLRRNRRADAVLYLRAWSELLEPGIAPAPAAAAPRAA